MGRMSSKSSNRSGHSAGSTPAASTGNELESLPITEPDRSISPVGARTVPTYVYFIQSGGKDGPVKVGVASSIKRRLTALQIGNPQPLRFLLALEIDPGEANASDVDAIFHRELLPVHIRGEWFEGDVTRNVAMEIAEEVTKRKILRVVWPLDLAA